MEGVRSSGIDPATSRRLGVDLFNHAWTLIEKEERTPEEDDEMIHAAHASAYHWRTVGTPVNFCRSEWQCSRAYAVLGRAEPALRHARRALELCEQAGEEAEEFDLPFCYEALARAHAVAGRWEESRSWLERGREAAGAIADEEDRGLVLADLATVPAGP